MATNDSRHNFKVPRWAADASGVASGNETEPSSGQKDVGWQPNVDSINGRWWNWLHQQAGFFLSYIENMWNRRWTEPHVMRAALGTGAGLVTDGTGLAVDVASARVWIAGAMYQVPAVTDLALATADATNPRYDLVVAELSGGVPQFAVITGTPGASPAEPSAGADQVPIYRVRVNAMATTPGTKADRREYGVLGLSRLEVAGTSAKFDVGDDGDTLKVRDNAGTNPTVELFDGAAGLPALSVYNSSAVAELVWLVGSGPLTLANLTGDLIIPAEQVEFASAITRKFDINACDFSLVDGAITRDATGTAASGVSAVLASDGDSVAACARVPNGATIVAVRAYVNRVTDVELIRVRLLKASKTTGATTQIGTAITPSGSGGTGDLTLAVTGLSEAVDQDSTYLVAVVFTGAGVDVSKLFNAEVEYEVTHPFDGL